MSLTPFGGSTLTWTDFNVESNKASINSMQFDFNVPDTNIAREYWIDNVTISETSSGMNNWFANPQANHVDSNTDLTWRHFGPGMSGYIEKLFINNGDPNAMYTELDMGNGHVTLDRGNFWTSYLDWDGSGTHPNGTTWIKFSHQDPDFGILIGKDMIYSTNDRGRSWNDLVDTHPASGNSEKHNFIAVDPSNDSNGTSEPGKAG